MVTRSSDACCQAWWAGRENAIGKTAYMTLHDRLWEVVRSPGLLCETIYGMGCFYRKNPVVFYYEVNPSDLPVVSQL